MLTGSPPDEEDWLDQDANLVDEEALVDLFEKASDYERALGRLDAQKIRGDSYVLLLVARPTRRSLEL